MAARENHLKDRLIHDIVDTSGFRTNAFSECFTYDVVGNRTSATYDATSTAYTPVTWNQYAVVGATTQSYDSNRNLTEDGVRSMTYDADDRLISCVKNGVTTSYVYDWQNRLIKRTVGGVTTRLIYSGWHVVAEVDDAHGSVSRTYLHGASTDEILADVDAGGNMHHLCTDHQGSTVAVLDQSGVLEEFYFHSAFGMLQWNSSPMVNYLFTGREFEPSSGLYNYRNRYYHPEQGRFLQPDPIRFRGGDVNLYAYCGNDPVNFVDPMGLAEAQLGVQADVCIFGGFEVGVFIYSKVEFSFWNLVNPLSNIGIGGFAGVQSGYNVSASAFGGIVADSAGDYLSVNGGVPAGGGTFFTNNADPDGMDVGLFTGLTEIVRNCGGVTASFGPSLPPGSLSVVKGKAIKSPTVREMIGSLWGKFCEFLSDD